MLGIPRRTFVTKLDAYRIPRPKKSASASEMKRASERAKKVKKGREDAGLTRRRA